MKANEYKFVCKERTEFSFLVLQDSVLRAIEDYTTQLTQMNTEYLGTHFAHWKVIRCDGETTVTWYFESVTNEIPDSDMFTSTVELVEFDDEVVD
jgi:hypothetical protein